MKNKKIKVPTYTMCLKIDGSGELCKRLKRMSKLYEKAGNLFDEIKKEKKQIEKIKLGFKTEYKKCPNAKK